MVQIEELEAHFHQKLPRLQSPQAAIEYVPPEYDAAGFPIGGHPYGYHANKAGEITALCLHCSRYANAQALAQALEPLRDMPQLQALMLTHAPLAGMDWQALPWLQQLTHFGLGLIRSADDDWGWLASMEGLEGLTLLAAAQWNKGILAALPTLKHLSYLDLSFNESLKDISVLSSLVGLTSLNLRNTGVRDVSVLSSLVGLTSLDLQETGVRDVSVLSSLVGLTSLNLQNAGVSDLKFLEPLTGLTALDLGNDIFAHGQGNTFRDVSVLFSLVGLTNLNLERTAVRDVSVLSSLVGLTSLNLAHTAVSDVSVLSSLVGLTSLNLAGIQVSDVPVLSSLVGLTSLNLASTRVSDVSVLSSLVGLTSLNLAHTAVSDVSVLSSLVGLTSLNLSGTEVSDVSVLSSLVGLTSLNLRNTGVRDVSVLSSLVGLTSLNLASTAVSDVSVLSLLVGLTSLNLARTAVSDVSVLSSLVGLTRLNLERARVSDVSVLSSLVGLTSLNLERTRVSNVSVLSLLVGLTSLNLASTAVSDVSVLSSLVGLTRLNLERARVSDVSVLSSLVGLTSLNLSWNEKLSDVSVLSSLVGLTSLNLSWNAKLSDVSVLSSLVGLTSLNLASIKVRDVSVLSSLVGLTSLNLNGSGIDDIKFLEPLTGLTSLDLGCKGFGHRNTFSDVSVLSSLVGLTRLNLYNCNVTNIEPLRSLLERGLRPSLERFEGDIQLYNNPIINPPKELITQGNQAIFDYWDDLEKHGGKPLNEVKVLLIGDGEAGKTSLSKRLRGQDFNSKQSQTHGIAIKPWSVTCGKQEVTAHLWDFGGQEVMHATHQFFLSQRSLYLLVLDSRREEKAEYWLKHTQTFGGGSPVLVLLNKIDENPGFEVDRKTLQAKYPNIAGFHRISCATGEGFADLQQDLERQIDALEICKHPFPKNWWNIKDWINQHPDSSITLKDYRKRCKQEGITKTSQDTLLGFLDNLGVALRFKHDRRTLVFDPEWLTQGVYRVINAKQVAQQQGVVQDQELPEILKITTPEEYSYEPEWHPFIMGLMESFELCYAITKDQQWLLPDLLPVQAAAGAFEGEGAVQFYYQYDFLPRSIFPRFLVKRHGALAKDAGGHRIQWRKGCVLRKGRGTQQTQALVVVDHEAKTLHLTVKGPDARTQVEFLSVLRDTLEGLHSGFSTQFQEETQAMVPVPGYAGAAIPYQELLDLEQMGTPVAKVPGRKANINVKQLLEGIEPPAKRMEQEKKAENAQVVVNNNFSNIGNPVVNNEANAKAQADATSENTITIDIAITTLGQAHDTLDSLADDLTDELEGDPDQEKATKKMSRALDSLTELQKAKNKESVNSGLMRKVKDFIEGLEDENSTLGKALTKVGKGASRVRELAGYYNKVAQWCALPQVPDLFVKKK